MNDNDLDRLIEEYSKKLMQAVPREQLTENPVTTDIEPDAAGGQGSQTPEEPENTAEENTEESMVEPSPAPEEESAMPQDTAEKESAQSETLPEAIVADGGEDNLPESEIIPEPVPTDPENFAYFTARIYAAGGAYAIENAKVAIYRGDVLHAFLITDQNGETKRIKLESYPEENSFEPLSDEQRLDYSADVSADGFITESNLLVSAVGGSDILLALGLTPESEGIN